MVYYPDQGLLIGTWTLWSFAMATAIARFVSRRMLFGTFKKYQLDEYLMLLTLATYTGVVVSANEVASHGSNYVPDGVAETWPPEMVEDAIYGSKMLMVLEQCELAVLWLVKACLLLLYARMTTGMRESIAVKILAVYCLVGYLVVQILYLGVWCRPVQSYYAVPAPLDQPQCKTYRYHMITTTAFHVSSDLAMLFIPLPLIIRARLPLRRKLVLSVVFSLGVFVVLVAILNRYFNFSQDNSYVFLIWYNGEAATAVMIANIPFCWTLLRRVFALNAWSATGSKTPQGSLGALPPTIGGVRMRFGGRAAADETLPWTVRDGSSTERLGEKTPAGGRSNLELEVLEGVGTESVTSRNGSDPESSYEYTKDTTRKK